MLDALDDIDWKSLKHAFGTADEVPDLIRSLVSDDENIAKEAIGKLFNWLHHQGSNYGAGVASIPFLIHILEYELSTLTGGILNLLITMSNGSRWSLLWTWEWDELAQEAVRKGLNVYLKHLVHPDKKTRFTALRMLCDSPLFEGNETSLIFNKVLAQYSMETDEFNQAAIILRIGYLFEWGGQYLEEYRANSAEFIQSIYESDNNEDLRLVASFTLPKLLRGQTPQHLVDDLVKLLANPPLRIIQGKKSSLGKRPMGTIAGGVDLFALTSLWYLDRDTRYSALKSALSSTDDSEKAIEIVTALMHWTFVGKTPSRPLPPSGTGPNGTRRYKYRIYIKQRNLNRLSEFQKLVVETIVNSDKVWVNSSNLLEAYGFPADRNETRQLLAE